ncbi:MAG: hypothetical protein WCS09_20380, partial [Pseudomonadota bacterium]
MSADVSRQDALALARVLHVDGVEYHYFSLAEAASIGLAGVDRLPFSTRVFVENLVRQRALGQSG